MTLPVYRYASTVEGVFSDGYLSTVNEHEAGTQAIAAHFNNNTSILWAVVANLNNRMLGIDGLDDGVTAATNNIIDTETTTHTSIMEVIEDMKGEGWETAVSGTKSLTDLYNRQVIANWEVTSTLKVDTIEDSTATITTLSDGAKFSSVGTGIKKMTMGTTNIGSTSNGGDPNIWVAAGTIAHGLGETPDRVIFSYSLKVVGGGSIYSSDYGETVVFHAGQTSAQWGGISDDATNMYIYGMTSPNLGSGGAQEVEIIVEWIAIVNA
jgi:hypothetical protein